MDARLLVSSDFMVSQEFGTRDIPREPLVTITEAKLAQVEQGKPKWGLLYFAEPWAKPLKINRTHQRALILMFGGETNAWRGKRIGLYAIEGEWFGQRQTAVRIRGSPDLKAPVAFTVKKMGGGTDSYKLVPLKATGAPVEERPPRLPGTVGFGTCRDVKLADLTPEQMGLALLEAEELKAKPMKPEHLAELTGLVEAVAAEQARRVTGAPRTPGEEG